MGFGVFYATRRPCASINGDPSSLARGPGGMRSSRSSTVSLGRQRRTPLARADDGAIDEHGVLQHRREQRLVGDGGVEQAEFGGRRLRLAQRGARRQAGGGEEAEELRPRPAGLQVLDHRRRDSRPPR